jgi:hypothetical protein
MTRWEVSFRLSRPFGDIELEYWPDLFNSPDCNVTKQDGGFWLTACRFEKLDRIDDVRESARKLVTIMKAFAKIELGTMFEHEQRDDDNVVTGIREHVGDTTNVNVFPGTATAHAFAFPAKVVIQDEHGNVITQPRQARWYDFCLDRCDDKINDTILRVLAYFARTSSWYNLYKAYELILYDINKNEHKAENWITEKGWVDADKKLSRNKLSDFRLSAQYYDFLVSPKGDLDESRHSPAHFLRKFKGKQPADVMHKPEAVQLIGRIIKGWLNDKTTTT